MEALDEERAGSKPIAVLPVSATEGIGMDALLEALGELMREEDEQRIAEIKGRELRRTTGEGAEMKIRF